MKSALRTFGLVAAFMLVGTPAIAYLTPAQQILLVNAIQADPVLAALPRNSDGAFDIAVAFNKTAAPAFTVWKTRVFTTQIGDNIVATELANMAQVDLIRLQTIVMLSEDGVNPSLADRRAFFDDVFSGGAGAGTRAKLLILWKRLATRAEAVFATGTGTNAAPATMTVEGPLSPIDVETARNCIADPVHSGGC